MHINRFYSVAYLKVDYTFQLQEMVLEVPPPFKCVGGLFLFYVARTYKSAGQVIRLCRPQALCHHGVCTELCIPWSQCCLGCVEWSILSGKSSPVVCFTPSGQKVCPVFAHIHVVLCQEWAWLFDDLTWYLRLSPLLIIDSLWVFSGLLLIVLSLHIYSQI